jgi:L-fuculose-phosphate aldolase
MNQDLLLQEERKRISKLGRKLVEKDLANNTMGNISTRTDDYIAVSPSGTPYGGVTPESVPVVSMGGDHVEGDIEPSSETPMHRVIYQNRDDVSGIVHTHSPYATTFATLGKEIPASYYLIAFAGQEVPIAPWAKPGSKELGELAAETLGEDSNAVLLQNHGVVSIGESVDAAFEVAEMVEFCARIHYQALNVGDPEILPPDEVDSLIEKFTSYGRS